MTRTLLERCLTKWLEDADPDECIDLVEAIRAHLAQPQGEPVAWMYESDGYLSRQPAAGKVPLYLHPAHTEAEVQEIMDRFIQREVGAVPLSAAEETVRRILGVPA